MSDGPPGIGGFPADQPLYSLNEPIGALANYPGWDEATLRAEIRLQIPGVPCEICSVGKLHTPTSKLSTRFVHHPANRPCTTVIPIPPWPGPPPTPQWERVASNRWKLP